MLWGVMAALVSTDPTPALPLVPPARRLVVPVLMYHHLREPGPSMADRLNARFDVSPTEFAKQLDFLRVNGYTAIDCRTLEAAVRRGKPLPAKPVMLTFDDGWREQYTIAFPLLKERGMVGVFYVHTGVLSDDPGRGYTTWADLCEMRDAGMDVQSHTISHPSLPGVETLKLDEELRVSKAVLERYFGEECISLAYPFGDFTEREVIAAERAGYRFALTTEVGLVHDRGEPFEIGRTIITSTDNLDDFAIKLTELDGGRAYLDYRQSITRKK
ncbi:MAG: polysaccharide deacetylase family protein [Phycisphaerales bacterium]|nr:polysaccharide deacetylase family protein [Phycisphaerales bacterium]